ncbi:hypothetical protein BH09PAT2_BH09PAT2_09610 [soil metagenome]
MRLRIVISTFIVITIALFSIAPVFAEEAGIKMEETVSSETSQKVETREVVQKNRQEIINDSRRMMQVKREEIKQNREDLHASMEAKRKESMEKFQTQREEFKKELQVIKDEKKKSIIENIDTKLNELNTTHSDNLAQSLTQITDILGRLDEKIASKEASGIDTTEVKAASANAHTLIDSAAAAVTAQSARQYILDITDEAKLREDVKKTVQTFKTDITAVHEKVKAAREAVVTVARLYGQLQKNENVSVSVTPSVAP